MIEAIVLVVMFYFANTAVKTKDMDTFGEYKPYNMVLTLY